jgi:hypothetical protein
MNPKKTVIPVLMLLLVLLAGIVELVAANPVPSPLVIVDSPHNNQIYPTNTVQLAFTKAPYEYYNFSSYSYSLDGQPAKPTDGNTVLTNLAAGSHTLTIYGSITYQTGSQNYTDNDLTLAQVYFSTVYSTAWVTFGLILTAFISVVSLVLFTNGRQLASRLKTKKTGIFWLGLACFLLVSIVLIAFVGGMASDYLFPYYPHRLEVILVSPVIGSIVCSVFLGLGFGMMALGTRERKARLKKQASAAPQNLN